MFIDNKYKRRIYWGLVIIWCLFIFYHSSKPIELSMKESFFFVDIINKVLSIIFNIKSPIINEIVLRKFAHFFEFMVLGFLTFNAFLNEKNLIKTLCHSFLFSFFYAISDEVHQYFVPGRSMRVGDIFIDLSGALTGVFLQYYTLKLKSKISL